MPPSGQRRHGGGEVVEDAQWSGVREPEHDDVDAGLAVGRDLLQGRAEVAVPRHLDVHRALDLSGVAADRRAVLEQESAILTAYLPPMASEEEVKAFIADTVSGLAERSPKQMGVVMGALKAKFGTGFDAKQANAWVKEALG